ncbi:hypothetical protein niasHS_005047 [Heterodera schachtii]|uniref:B30.2/SPRY domain-containing protein n=1 Tax=Heterodera schachtii TaxID=97005 RepID=A0ABD2JKD7_HETSC
MASSSNLGPSEELRLLRDRIKELEQMEEQAKSSGGTSAGADEMNPSEKGGQNEGNCANSFAEQQKEMKELRKKFAKMEVREAKHLSKIDELEKRTHEAESEKQKLIADRNVLQAKVAKMEKKQKKRKEEKEKYIAAFAQIMQLQAEKNNLQDKISKMKKQQHQRMLLNFRQNSWDAIACHNELKIIDANNSVVQCKGTNCELRSIFAKHSILLNNDSSDIFYFEISIKNLGGFPIVFGFAVKQQTKLDKRIYPRNGTYARSSNGTFWINGSPKGPNADYSYGVGDVVGCGFSLATRQIIFTKNGRRLYSSDLVENSLFASSADGSLFPCVSLRDFDDKIEANFGPDFKFDLDTL